MNIRGILIAVGLMLTLGVTQSSADVRSSTQAGTAGPSSAVESAEQARYIVVFRNDVRDAHALAVSLARQHGFNVRLVYSVALKGFSATLPANAVSALVNDPRVVRVERDSLAHTMAQTVPTGVSRIFATSNANLSIDGMDDQRVDVDVAVIDTGVADHPDLDVVHRADCTGNPFNMSCTDNSGLDGNGHGTHVAGTIGALDNGIGVVGVAPGARIWSVKVLKDNGSGWISNIIGGVDWVAGHGIPVANMSIGGGDSPSLCTAVEGAVATGVTFAVAAGNDNQDTANSSPANCAGVIAVSALADFNGQPGGGASSTCRSDVDDTLADFSNWGSKVDIAAPGVCIESTWNDGGYNTISGTSMAAPHVAGAAALLASKGGMTPAEIKATLVGKGNFDWVDDSGDGIQEPLLDVSDASVFAPNMVSGSGGGAPLNTAPVVTISTPLDGGTFDSGATISFAGTASDAQDGDLTRSLAWTSSIDGAIGSGGSFNAALSDGTHDITATVTDGDGASGTASVRITVGAAPSAGSTMHVGSIVFGKKGPNLNVTVTIVSSTGAPVSGASIDSVALRLDDDGNAGFNCGSDTCWNFQPLTTDANGQASYKLLHAPSGNYQFEVLGLTDSALTWDKTADVDNPQTWP